jgi:hypothetical protein
LKDSFPDTPDFRPVGIEDVKNDDDEDDDIPMGEEMKGDPYFFMF